IRVGVEMPPGQEELVAHLSRFQESGRAADRALFTRRNRLESLRAIDDRALIHRGAGLLIAEIAFEIGDGPHAVDDLRPDQISGCEIYGCPHGLLLPSS